MAAFAKLASNLTKIGVGLAVGGAVVNSALYNGNNNHHYYPMSTSGDWSILPSLK